MRDDHYSRFRKRFYDLPGRFESINFGHLYIHQNDIRTVLSVTRKSLRAIAAFKKLVDLISHKTLNHPTHRLTVFYD